MGKREGVTMKVPREPLQRLMAICEELEHAAEELLGAIGNLPWDEEETE